MLYTLIDIETTGFNRVSDEMLEFGYMQIDSKYDIVRHGTLYFYKDGWELNPEAQRVNGITREMLIPHKDEFEGNIVRLYSLMSGGIVIGKNSDSFDIPFITSFLQKYASELRPMCVKATLDLQDVYTKKFQSYYKEKYGVSTRKKGKLEELVVMIGLNDAVIRREFTKRFPDERAGAHSALYDVFMSYLLLKYAILNYGVTL